MNPALRSFFEEGFTDSKNKVSADSARAAANYLTSDVLGLLSTREESTLNTKAVSGFVKLIEMLQKGEIGSRVAKDLLPQVIFDLKDPQIVAKELGLLQMSSVDDLKTVIDAVIENNPKVVEDYRAGKEASVQYLVGQAMKETKGSANPAVLLTLFKEELK